MLEEKREDSLQLAEFKFLLSISLRFNPLVKIYTLSISYQREQEDIRATFKFGSSIENKNHSPQLHKEPSTKQREEQTSFFRFLIHCNPLCKKLMILHAKFFDQQKGKGNFGWGSNCEQSRA